VEKRDVAFVDVQVGAANSAGEDAEEGMAFGKSGAGDVFDLEGRPSSGWLLAYRGRKG